MALVFSTVTVAITPSNSVSPSHSRTSLEWVEGHSQNIEVDEVQGKVPTRFQPVALTWDSTHTTDFFFWRPIASRFLCFLSRFLCCQSLASWQRASYSDFYSLPRQWSLITLRIQSSTSLFGLDLRFSFLVITLMKSQRQVQMFIVL